MIYYFTRDDIRLGAIAKNEQVEGAFRTLCLNPEFVRSLETTTKSISAVDPRSDFDTVSRKILPGLKDLDELMAKIR